MKILKLKVNQTERKVNAKIGRVFPKNSGVSFTEYQDITLASQDRILKGILQNKICEYKNGEIICRL